MMDNTLITALIVAGTSLATLAATNYVAIKNKRIDAEQKINEHKMSIRNIYVTKKIQAGEAFMAKIHLLSHLYYL